MSSQTIQAAVCTRHGAPADVMTVEQRPMPVPGPGQVLVRMLAAPINPSDVLFIKGNYGIGPQPPTVPGFEGVGIVESGGGFLGWLRRGNRVAVLSPDGGTWGGYCVTKAQTVIPLPPSLTDEQGASFFINPATALMLTQWVFPVPMGNWIIQSAAASSLGRMVIRLGQHFKFRTINVVRRQEHVDELKALGADAVIVADEQTPIEEFNVQVDHITMCARPKFAIDPVGGKTGELLFNALGSGGRMRVFASLSEQPIPVHPRKMIVKNLGIESFWLGRSMEALSLPQKIKFVRQLSELHTKGVFQVEDFKTFPLSETVTALEVASSATGGTKVILTTK
ncbi:zinc-dependent alcohol dehydrogenase family protein [Planctomicrobium piriforme]|uniref:zinc-dependent alcohol dehydrogenase family protein n=1 Tax=Planctomicrobium piriforme TaxID=1576369 RepID=UPI001C316F2D|nr:zinc-dependent alcohol dehydrogenase family protein [Planctomicrobium piriforme]